MSSVLRAASYGCSASRRASSAVQSVLSRSSQRRMLSADVAVEDVAHDYEELAQSTSNATTETHTERRRALAFNKAVISFMSNFGSAQTRENSFQPHHPLHAPLSPNKMALSALIAAGAHMGHSRALTRPSFLPYAYGFRAGITIIDLDQTLPLLRRAANLTRAVAENDGLVLFVGTTDALRPAVRKAAERMGENGFHVGTKWMPGMLTNSSELFGPDAGKQMNVKPDLVTFLNPLQNLHAIRECAIAHIPTIGIIDSNADPRIVMYPIPANDESVRTAELIVGMLSVAGREGVQNREKMEEQIRTRTIARQSNRFSSLMA